LADTVGRQQPRSLDRAKSTRLDRIEPRGQHLDETRRSVVEHGGHSAVRVRGFVVAELGED
jgi:hypothetical protein